MHKRQMSILSPRRIFNEDLVDSFFNSPIVSPMINQSRINMFEEDDNVVVEFEAPGYNSDDFDISIEDNMLTVEASSTTQEEENDAKKKYYYAEISQQSMTRSVNLPIRVKADDATADYKNGMLKITIPKAEEAKPKRIKISA